MTLIDTLNIRMVAILPEILLACLAIGVLVVDFFLKPDKQAVLGYISVLGLLIVLPVTAISMSPGTAFGGAVMADPFAIFFSVILIVGAVLTLFISTAYLPKMQCFKGEYYPLVLFATLGMLVLVKASDLITFYVGLELMALCFYVLVALKVRGKGIMEGALKYFVLGALSSGILLYGMSFVFGATGSTRLDMIAQKVVADSLGHPYLMLGVALTVVGFGFKVALFPFHIWAPDAYEGAPTPVTAFLSVGSKAAAFAVFMRLFLVAFPGLQTQWVPLLWALSAATMIFGSLVAIVQTNIVRMLAYSSIAHAGIIMIGLLTTNASGLAGMLYYLMVYLFMNMGAFTLVSWYVQTDGGGEEIANYSGLAAKHPMAALMMTVFLLALAGIPPTGGFLAKFFLFAAAVKAQEYWLAGIGVIATAVALFFYTKVIFYMYMKPPASGLLIARMGVAYKIVIFVTVVGTLVTGIYPGPFIDMARWIVEPFLS